MFLWPLIVDLIIDKRIMFSGQHSSRNRKDGWPQLLELVSKGKKDLASQGSPGQARRYVCWSTGTVTLARIRC